MLDPLLNRLDQFQRRHPIIGFPYAVFTRYREDHGGWLGSLVSYYGFFSLYPLLIVFVTVSSWLFSDRPDLMQQVLEALWSQLPFADAGMTQAQVDERVSSLGPNPWVFALSLLVTLWGGLGVVKVLQDGVNSIWGVARFRRPRSLRKILHSLALLGLLGLGLVVSAVVAAVTLAAGLPFGGLVAAAIANLALIASVTVAVYRMAIATETTIRELIPGACIIAAGGYTVTLIGGLYVQNVVARMTGLYGPFASTIGLLAYISLIVQIFVVGTEVNVVRSRQLWPRSMTATLGEADHRAMRLTMSREALSSTDVLTMPRPPHG
jgi:membrane protein